MFRASDSSGRLLVLKQLHVKADEERELKCCEELRLDALSFESPEALVPTRVQTVHLRDCDDNDSYNGEEEDTERHRRCSVSVLVMPRFVASLQASSLRGLKPSVLIAQAKRMVRALNFIHRTGRVHMDVKADNIFLLASGDWYLGDFGSCVAVRSPIHTYTPGCSWEPLRQHESPAQFRFDWGMLAVCVLKLTHTPERERQGNDPLPPPREVTSWTSDETGLMALAKLEVALCDLSRNEPTAELGALLSRILQHTKRELEL